MVLRLLTTLAWGNRRCSCSPTLSVLATANEGGIPLEKSSALETSTSSLPLMLSSPACSRAARDTIPPVQLKSTSPKAAASANVPWLARSPASAPAAQAVASSLSAVRLPMRTAWPTSTSFEAMALPTMPVPRTPIFMLVPFVWDHAVVILEHAPLDVIPGQEADFEKAFPTVEHYASVASTP